MTVLVTGATGHLGANLVRALLAQGRPVRALVRGEATLGALEGLPVARVRGDVLDPAAVDAAVAGVDVVYHLAARISLVPSDAAVMGRVNVEGPRHVATACLRHGVRRLVHFSSVHALSPPEGDGVTDETRPLNVAPDAPAYDRSKSAGEAEILKAVARGLDAVIVNPTGVLGPYAFYPEHQLRFLLDVYHGVLPALLDGGFNWVDARDVVQGALAAETRGRCGERYLLSGSWVSARDVACAIEAATGRRTRKTSLPLWVARLGVPFAALHAALTRSTPLYTASSLRALREHRRCDPSKAQRELGYTARPFAETIADTFAFWGELGLLQPEARRHAGRRAALRLTGPSEVPHVAP